MAIARDAKLNKLARAMAFSETSHRGTVMGTMSCGVRYGRMSTQEAQPDTPLSDLAGRRVLVVEDSPVVAEASEDMLRDMGCAVIGPATNMASALQLAAEEELDAAIVDINIRGGKA